MIDYLLAHPHVTHTLDILRAYPGGPHIERLRSLRDHEALAEYSQIPLDKVLTSGRDP